MTTARSPAWLLALGLLLAAACGEPERKLLSSLGGPTEFDTSATDPSKGEGGGIGEWVTPSSKLGCGQPCDDHDVTADGWCADSGVAVRCEAGVVVCEECGAVGRDCTVGDAAPARCLRACDGEEVCPPGGECFTLQCCGNARWCERNAQAICSPDGGNLKVQECLEGLDCIDGQCVPARPLVHVLFDTSGSMTWNPHTGGEVPGDWPACDDPQNPQSRLGISKRAFSELFSDVQYDHVLFSLQRFPQRLDALLLPMCPGGAYETQDKITGHKGIYVIGDDETGAWFTENLGEVLLVPFPKASFDSNRDELTAWLDFAELSTTTTDACNAHSDCAGGLCTAPGTASGGVCRTFENPELRALGWTPLGTSLYYAAEYFRKYVVVDGAPCLLNVDCLSATYICDNGTCRDPNRFCRQRSIVVFTDGVDTASLGAWRRRPCHLQHPGPAPLHGQSHPM